MRETIGDAERPSQEWEDGEAERRRARFEKRKLGRDNERRQDRAGLTTFQLFLLAVKREAKLSTVPAGNLEPSRGGGDRVGPPGQQLLEDDPGWAEDWQVIRSRLLHAHEKLDEAEGLGASAVRSMLTDEKNREILVKGRGLSARAVFDLLGRDIAGSPETVRRVRRRTQDPTSPEFRLLGFAVASKDGEPIREGGVRPVGEWRRVVIDKEA